MFLLLLQSGCLCQRGGSAAVRGCHQSLHPHSRPWHTLLGLPLGCQPRPRALLSTNPSPNWWALPKPVSPAQQLFWLVLGLGCALVCTTDECAHSVAASQGWEKGWMARVTWASGGKNPSLAAAEPPDQCFCLWRWGGGGGRRRAGLCGCWVRCCAQLWRKGSECCASLQVRATEGSHLLRFSHAGSGSWLCF